MTDTRRYDPALDNAAYRAGLFHELYVAMAERKRLEAVIRWFEYRLGYDVPRRRTFGRGGTEGQT